MEQYKTRITNERVKQMKINAEGINEQNKLNKLTDKVNKDPRWNTRENTRCWKSYESTNKKNKDPSGKIRAKSGFSRTRGSGKRRTKEAFPPGGKARQERSLRSSISSLYYTSGFIIVLHVIYSLCHRTVLHRISQGILKPTALKIYRRSAGKGKWKSLNVD